LNFNVKYTTPLAFINYTCVWN